MYQQDDDLNEIWRETGVWDDNNPDLKNKWDANATYHDMDFLMAAATFLQTPVMEALYSDNYIIRIFAIVDRRIGKRTLQKCRESEDVQRLPSWVKQFYELRTGGIGAGNTAGHTVSPSAACANEPYCQLKNVSFQKKG